MIIRVMFIFLFFVSFSKAEKINIAVAANVSYAINNLITEFNKSNPNVKVLVTLGSSGKLTAQIKNGAPYDLFMSANMDYPNSLYKDNIAIAKPIIYAKGSLALLSFKPRDFTKGLELLKDKTIEKIVIANEKTAPYGKAAKELLQNANIYDALKKKFVYAESISQAVAYTITAADIGLIAKSSLYSSKMSMYKKDIHYSEVDSTLYTPINQGVVILKKAKHNKEVEAFYSFLVSKKAQAIFKNYGYLLP